MGKIKNIIKPNADKTDFVCYLETKSGTYDKRDVNTRVSRSKDTKTITYVDESSGEVIHTKKVNIVSDANSKFHIFSTCTDFAKSKNVPRVKIKACGRHIIDIIRDYPTYLQCSTGSTHRTRGIVAVDIDCLKKESDDVDCIRSAFEQKADACLELGIPMPTSYQIHLTNGHIQVYWVFDEELVINDIKAKEVVCADGVERKMFMFVKNKKWESYMNVMRFLAIVFDGDPQFTGWQIKNMFFVPDENEGVFKNEFMTVWRSGNEWTTELPENLERCSFDDINNVVDVFVSKPNEELIDFFGDVLSKHGCDKHNILSGMRLCSGFHMTKQAKKFYSVTEADIDNSLDIGFRADAELENMGRNQFVRMKTLEVIRRKKNKLTREYCYTVVKKEFMRAMKDGILKGTHNHSRDYTDSDFDRDFDSTFDYGTENYGNNVWTDVQRSTAAKTNRSKKTRKLILLIKILEDNPDLIRNNAKNNRCIIDIFKECYDIDIKTVNTIAAYKRELKLKDCQKNVSKRNYRAMSKRSKKSEEYADSVKSVYEKLAGYGFFGDAAACGIWKRRIENISGNDVYRIFRNTYKTNWNKEIYETRGYSFESKVNSVSSMEFCNKNNIGGQRNRRYTGKEVSAMLANTSHFFGRGNLCRGSSQRPSLHNGIPLQICNPSDT